MSTIVRRTSVVWFIYTLIYVVLCGVSLVIESDTLFLYGLIGEGILAGVVVVELLMQLGVDYLRFMWSNN